MFYSRYKTVVNQKHSTAARESVKIILLAIFGGSGFYNRRNTNLETVLKKKEGN